MIALIVVSIIAILALAACTVWLTIKSLPAGLESRQKRFEAKVADLATRVAEIVDERSVWKAQGERLAEEVSGYLEQIERKRSSTAAAASRIAGRQPQLQQERPNLGTMTRSEQIAHARAQLGG